MTFRDTADVARRSAWLVAVPVLLAAVVALVLSLLSTPLYRASADVSVDGPNAGEDRAVTVEMLVASGSELLAEVRDIVGDDPELAVEDVGTDVLRFTASSANADDAAAAANVYAETYVAGWAPGAEVVDRAVAPSDPYEPRVVRSVLLAALAGLVIGIAASAVVARRDPTIRSERQLGKVTALDTLAVVSALPSDGAHPEGAAVLRRPDSVESEGYRTLLAALDPVVRDGSKKVLAVTSLRPGQGESSVAANLAVAVAQSGRRVVLVDGDLRRPQVHRWFSIGNERGLSSVVLGEAPLQACVHRVDQRNLMVLTAGPPPDRAETLSHERLGRAVEALAGGSDLVVIDAPPVLPMADPIPAGVVDAALLVATAGTGDRAEWEAALHRLRTMDVEVVGTVLWCPDPRASGRATASGGGAAGSQRAAHVARDEIDEPGLERPEPGDGVGECRSPRHEDAVHLERGAAAAPR